jgi:ATP-dependent RNA helicase DHX33
LNVCEAGREALIEEIRSNEVTILIGETGSGKTTRMSSPCNESFILLKFRLEIPQYLLESGISANGVIAVTQPRRVAATSLASRVAQEQNGSSVGNLVGYSVRFDEKYSAETRIKYMTDGMIVRELLSDPLLSKYSVVIVDEAHERTLRTDLLLANLKTVLRQRRRDGRDKRGKGKENEERPGPLKVVVMSATLDAEKFSKFFNQYALYLMPSKT